MSSTWQNRNASNENSHNTKSKCCETGCGNWALTRILSKSGWRITNSERSKGYNAKVVKPVVQTMTVPPTMQITVNFQDADANTDKQEKLTQTVYQQLRSLDGIQVDRVTDPNPPEGSRALGAFLWGLLQAKVSRESLKTLFDFLGDRLGDKPIEFNVTFADGRTFEGKASSRAELQALEDTIKRLAEIK